MSYFVTFFFFLQGWIEALFGPTFPDLRLIINEDLDTASWLLTGTSIGFLVGSIVAGGDSVFVVFLFPFVDSGTLWDSIIQKIKLFEKEI